MTTDDRRAFEQMAYLADRMAMVLWRARGDLAYAQANGMRNNKMLDKTITEIDYVLADARAVGVFHDTWVCPPHSTSFPAPSARIVPLDDDVEGLTE